LMVQYLNWRWIFYSAVPVELAAFIFALTRLKGEWADARGERFDWVGSGIYMASLAAIIVGIVESHEFASASWFALGGIGGMAIFLLYESRIISPIFPLKKIVDNRVFMYSNLATWLNYAASFGVTFFFSLYLQVIRGVSPRDAGFILVFQPLIQAVCAPVAGRMADRYHPAHIATAGMAFCTVALGFAATLTATTHFIMVYGILALMGLGFGFFSTPNSTAIMSSISPRDYGMASSMIATMRTTGMLTSMTLTTLLLSYYLGDQPITSATGKAFVLSMHSAMILFSVMGLFAMFFSMVRIRHPHASHRGDPSKILRIK